MLTLMASAESTSHGGDSWHTSEHTRVSAGPARSQADTNTEGGQHGVEAGLALGGPPCDPAPAPKSKQKLACCHFSPGQGWAQLAWGVTVG